MTQDTQPASTSPVRKDSSERRQSSGMFANLQQAKRDPQNANATSRRLSAAEHRGAPNAFSSLWNSTFRS
ncbi:hypothetical protein AMS68_003520 [Peltaster fructicola]|uniref:Conidiation-specific protein 8 n=1 Tax=Peltaster fructicola TaxID=286661 RepID=A0A6H0XTF9_9PEZI|nr:hypothetical protein AMS68_003520 [Peltaster fructicola]